MTDKGTDKIPTYGDNCIVMIAAVALFLLVLACLMAGSGG